MSLSEGDVKAWLERRRTAMRKKTDVLLWLESSSPGEKRLLTKDEVEQHKSLHWIRNYGPRYGLYCSIIRDKESREVLLIKAEGKIRKKRED